MVMMMEGATEASGPPLKSDERFSKYFKMLSVGLSKEAVQHRMQRDGLDPKILDMDPDKPYSDGTDKSATEASGPPLKSDERFSKYFKMLSVGLSKEAVQHRMQRDGLDPKVLDMDPDKPYSDGTDESATEASGPPLKSDERFSKYFKMLSVGLSKEAVQHRMQRDGLDPKVLDMDPDKPYSDGTDEGATEALGPPLKSDERFSKYFKMLSVGLSKEAVQHRMQRDGLDPKILDMDPDKPYSDGTDEGATEASGPPLKSDERFSKYFKMLSVGLSKEAVQHRMQRDGLDPKILDMDPDKPYSDGTDKSATEALGPPLKSDERFSKYFKMLSVGLSKEAVQHRMQRDGLDPKVLDMDPDKPYTKGAGTMTKKVLKKKVLKPKKEIRWLNSEKTSLEKN